MVTHQLQVECRTVKVRRSKTDVLPTVPRNQPGPVAWHSCVGCAGCVCLTSQDSHLDVYNVSSGTLNPTIPYIQRPPTNHALHAKIACCQFNYWLILSYGFLSFSFWGGTRSLRMPALRPASQASPMRNPRKGTSVVLRDTIRLT